MVDVQAMQVFLAAAETENFSAAAHRLGLSQPAISFRIHSLEENFKLKLFERIGKRVVLAEAGRELMPMARELIYLAADIEKTFIAQPSSLEGQLVIGCGTGLARYLLPRLIGVFAQHYPRVRVSCEGMTAQVAEEKLARREIHLGVVSARVKSKRLDCDPFIDDELVLVAAAAHPWTKRETISPSELGEVEWVLNEEDRVAREILSANLEKQGVAVDTLRVAV